FYIFLDRYGRS
ncbi:putative exported protease domain protein, partial [Chlamydia psittaci 03DC29]